ncbi:MAG: putative rane protein [Herbinix sp.]|jgi:biotin transport system substrate-specific component|nr:putative rane protein [Herbinix sp.]
MNQFQNEATVKNKSISTRDMVFTGMFTAVICVMAQIQIPVQPIPFTLAVFSIFLTGALLPPRYALMSVLAYILLGAVGLPVFANFKGGLDSLVGPTGGYIMAYPIMALVTSLFSSLFKKVKIVGLAAGMIFSLFLCYLIGTLWFSFSTNNEFYYALTVCVFPFVLFDLLKIVLAISVSMVIRKTVFRNIY